VHTVDRPPLSVVVPTHEGSTDWLPECLHALTSQTVPRADLEVLVVLDGPAPGAAEIVRGVLPSARRLDLARNRGFAAAATAGLRAARGDLVAVLNDDATPEPGWAQALIEAAARYPDAGSFASRVLQHDDPSRIDSAGHGLTRWGEPFERGHGDLDGPRYDADAAVFGAPASASAYRRELVRDCGGFDATMEAYLEDIDLSLRAQALGFPCRYVAAARVKHRHGASYGEVRAARLIARNRVHVLLKSVPRNVLRAGGPAAIASIAAGLLGRLGRRQAPVAAALGVLDGLRGARASLTARPGALGARRVDDSTLMEVMSRSEQDLVELCARPGAGRARRARATLARTLSAWTDSRGRHLQRPRW